jgi:hypothetical protein
MKTYRLILVTSLLLCLTHEAFAEKIYVLATGRRDPRIYAIDLQTALRPENNNTEDGGNRITFVDRLGDRTRRPQGIRCDLRRSFCRHFRRNPSEHQSLHTYRHRMDH